MITELTALIFTGGSVVGGGLFFSRWVDGVNERLNKLDDGVNAIREEQVRVKTELEQVHSKLPNGEIGTLIEEVRALRADLTRQ